MLAQVLRMYSLISEGVALYVGQTKRPIKARSYDSTDPHKRAKWWRTWQNGAISPNARSTRQIGGRTTAYPSAQATLRSEAFTKGHLPYVRKIKLDDYRLAKWICTEARLVV